MMISGIQMGNVVWKYLVDNDVPLFGDSVMLP